VERVVEGALSFCLIFNVVGVEVQEASPMESANRIEKSGMFFFMQTIFILSKYFFSI